MPLCTITELEDLISPESVTQASNDGQGADKPNTTAVANAIERGEQQLKQYITGRYLTTAISTNDWAKWACAVLSAVQLFRRRGNPTPPGLLETHNELIEHLRLIRDGSAEVPDGTPRIEPGLVMSNMRYDARYPRQKMRAQTAISVGQQESQKVRRTDIADVLPLNL